jgi:ectoine hydroxylase-related dioxygenase (phytanoyl-CoA dioxygenase family)
MNALATRLVAALQAEQPSVLRSRGTTYGSRDLAALFPEVCELPRERVLRAFLHEVLGPRAGLVRALFFDKPPERSWSLPWHKDRTIAVKDNQRPSTVFGRPTLKAGIPHVEAPEEILAGMLTLRIHLDAMTSENGPLSVIPGSHQTVNLEAGDLEGDGGAAPVEIHAAAGDVLAMRPLLSHSSSMPREGNTRHRRIIHLEFAPTADLPDGYEWHSFDGVG